MPNQSPHGNLTATLVVVALLELLVDRLLGRLFVSPGCRSGLGCLVLQSGPFLLHLTGVLVLVVGGGGIVGHLRRGELFPRGMRLTIAALSGVFLLLVALSLFLGRIPERYQIHMETSFGFVVALLVLSFVGSGGTSVRARVGFFLFALPVLMHVAAVVAARAGWLAGGPVSPERLTSLGEAALLLATTASPLLLLPTGIPVPRIGAGLAVATGVCAFFFVAFLGRTDLVQAVALYGVQLELPRPLSMVGASYVLALLGYTTSVAVLLFSAGPARLSGLGLCLLALGGYQTSSPVALGLSLCGLLALATGLVRGDPRAAQGKPETPLSVSAWQASLGRIAAEIADQPTVAPEPATIEVAPADVDGEAGDSDVGRVQVRRRGRIVTICLRRVQGALRRVEVTVGTPPDAPADATIESHEAWLGRREQDRVPLSRVKTGDPVFDRKLGIHGSAPLREPELRRRVLRLSEGSIDLWSGRAARFVAPGNPTQSLRRFGTPSWSPPARPLADLVDTLIDLIEAGQQTAPPDAAA